MRHSAALRTCRGMQRSVPRRIPAAHKVYRSAEILSFINKRNEPNKHNGVIEIVLETLMVVH